MLLKKLAIFTPAAGLILLLSVPSFADGPVITRTESDFDFPVVDCGDFVVWTAGKEVDTLKMWYDETGAPLQMHFSLKVKESEYYNYSDSSKSVSQGKNGVGENVTQRYDFVTGLYHNTGAAYRLTIPGMGAVILDLGNFFYDPSTNTLIHHGPAIAYPQGETGLKLCEALR